ncbi:1-aminocyclopropane-1-carboxylate deaminase/D-cysteine desulfhydrase [Thalassotalea sp. M1531]|uniref:1-aminocyclopropane-1-carboxylate deaminase/D-cysteine desulfhydrase n=1 Tax=Thalassotalea algicola TaxID=2716224 RepID=A0A7Y0LCA8_9GAMM|nr:pyridoxal-phosphate dependent enzyme [Thalassotalea algicola]NMP31918.1 1-aminocyclopropane-1-carboxylate deaminase/D-cysteine desulfhydrase [Thalassotalea algicola]
MLPSPLQPIKLSIFQRYGVEVFIKRDDLIHPIISGNKWRKLKGNIAAAQKLDKQGILSFGGAYSNHIHALAYACKQNNMKSIGIVRGEAQYQNNYTLTWARHWGMQVEFVDRKTYKCRHNEEYLYQLQQQYPEYYIVPEGGTNHTALSGVGEVITELNQQIDFDTVILPVGSAGTISGLIKADNAQHHILGVAVLKQAEYLNSVIEELAHVSQDGSWTLLTDYHRGGYAKFSEHDCAKLAQFSTQTGIPVEPVYSGKMVLALLELLEQGYFPSGHRIVLIHTGGLQGLGGQIERKLLPEEFIRVIQSHLPSAPQAL